MTSSWRGSNEYGVLLILHTSWPWMKTVHVKSSCSSRRKWKQSGTAEFCSYLVETGHSMTPSIQAMEVRSSSSVRHDGGRGAFKAAGNVAASALGSRFSVRSFSAHFFACCFHSPFLMLVCRTLRGIVPLKCEIQVMERRAVNLYMLNSLYPLVVHIYSSCMVTCSTA